MSHDVALAFTWARRELRAGLGGFWVFLACLALGVGAIAGVGAVSLAVQEALQRDARALAGGDLIVRTSYQPASAEQIGFMEGNSQTISRGLEMRVMAGGADATERRLAEFKAVDSAYPIAGQFLLEGGGSLADALAERDGRWGAVAEQGLFDLLRLAVGDPITVGSQTYTLRSVIEREPDRSTGLASFGPRLLVAQGDTLHDQSVTDLPQWLRRGDRLVLNDTRVIPARLTGARHRNSAQGHVSAKIEATLLEPRGDGTWGALIKPLRKLKQGEEVVFSADLRATLEDVSDGQGILRFNCRGDDFDAALNAAGAMPLPPYIAAKRPADAQDHTDYQTVWARNSGAVAAPTASLHFDEPLLQRLAKMGVTFTYVTLHVGAGTFLPVKVDDISARRNRGDKGGRRPGDPGGHNRPAPD